MKKLIVAVLCLTSFVIARETTETADVELATSQEMIDAELNTSEKIQRAFEQLSESDRLEFMLGQELSGIIRDELIDSEKASSTCLTNLIVLFGSSCSKTCDTCKSKCKKCTCKKCSCKNCKRCKKCCHLIQSTT